MCGPKALRHFGPVAQSLPLVADQGAAGGAFREAGLIVEAVLCVEIGARESEQGIVGRHASIGRGCVLASGGRCLSSFTESMR